MQCNYALSRIGVTTCETDRHAIHQVDQTYPGDRTMPVFTRSPLWYHCDVTRLRYRASIACVKAVWSPNARTFVGKCDGREA
jgi:hypothetical protein